MVIWLSLIGLCTPMVRPTTPRSACRCHDLRLFWSRKRDERGAPLPRRAHNLRTVSRHWGPVRSAPGSGQAGAKAWLDVIVKEAFDQQGAGDDEVHHWVSAKLRSFKWYCRWVDDGDQLVSTLRDVRDRIRRPMQEATRRDILMLQRKSLRGVSDHRVADVQESLPTYMARE